MRKELLVYVATAERGEEISVTAISTNRVNVLINASGNKFTANRAELVLALLAIEQFDKDNNEILVEVGLVPEVYINDIEYVEE